MTHRGAINLTLVSAPSHGRLVSPTPALVTADLWHIGLEFLISS